MIAGGMWPLSSHCRYTLRISSAANCLNRLIIICWSSLGLKEINGLLLSDVTGSPGRHVEYTSHSLSGQVVCPALCRVADRDSMSSRLVCCDYNR